MRTFETPAEMAAFAEAARAAGKRIAFVPTMGALHAGHASLLEEGRRRGDLLVLSIFVNPMQFGPKEDLSRYPRTPQADEETAHAAGVDVLYAPTADAMYPLGYQTTVTVEELEQGMCGAARPGHFRGVATVVLKLFSAVKPHFALFGQKDYQQLMVLTRMSRDLDLGVEVVGLPIVREPDGLAMSSRNVYLSGEERKRALALSRALRAAEALHASGERDGARLLAAASAVLEPLLEVEALTLDYLELRDAESLKPVGRVVSPAVIAVAARLGKTRLIDNIVLGR